MAVRFGIHASNHIAGTADEWTFIAFGLWKRNALQFLESGKPFAFARPKKFSSTIADEDAAVGALNIEFKIKIFSRAAAFDETESPILDRKSVV